jgi:perosamine synthetase
MANQSESSVQVFTQTATTPIKDLDRWQQVGEDEARLVYEMTLRNELSGGTEVVREFEKEFREYHGLKHCITTFNGTTALWSAMYGLEVGPGDEVIAPVNTWICTISSAPMLGATPVLVDVDPATNLMDPEDVRKKITSRTKAIIPVHLWGWVCDLDALMDISRETGIPIIEDCSHAHGARYRDKVVGSIGHVGAWSMQGSKAVSAGEGGAIASDEDEIIDRAALLGQCNRVIGLDLKTKRYERFQPLGVGIKFRSHPLAMGIAQVQFRKLDALNARRKNWVESVEAGLVDIPGLKPLGRYEGTERGGFYNFPVLYDAAEIPGSTLDTLVEVMNELGVPVGTRGYGNLHELPYFAEGFDIYGGHRGPMIEGYGGYEMGDFPGAEELVEKLIFLPVLSDPVDGAVEEVLRRIQTAVESF